MIDSGWDEEFGEWLSAEKAYLEFLADLLAWYIREDQDECSRDPIGFPDCFIWEDKFLQNLTFRDRFFHDEARRQVASELEEAAVDPEWEFDPAFRSFAAALIRSEPPNRRRKEGDNSARNAIVVEFIRIAEEVIWFDLPSANIENNPSANLDCEPNLAALGWPQSTALARRMRDVLDEHPEITPDRGPSEEAIRKLWRRWKQLDRARSGF